MKMIKKTKENMVKFKNGVAAFMGDDWDAKDKTLALLVAVLSGILIGVILSPIKGGIFSNNKIGCGNIGSLGDEDFDDDDEDDDED